MRLIDADALEKEVLKESDFPDDEIGCLRIINEKEFIKLIQSSPTIEARPVRKMVWIEKGWDMICGCCGMSFSEMPYSYDAYAYGGKPEYGYVDRFCPNCGAEKED